MKIFLSNVIVVHNSLLCIHLNQEINVLHYIYYNLHFNNFDILFHSKVLRLGFILFNNIIIIVVIDCSIKDSTSVLNGAFESED